TDSDTAAKTLFDNACTDLEISSHSLEDAFISLTSQARAREPKGLRYDRETRNRYDGATACRTSAREHRLGGLPGLLGRAASTEPRRILRHPAPPRTHPQAAQPTHAHLHDDHARGLLPHLRSDEQGPDARRHRRRALHLRVTGRLRGDGGHDHR